MARAASAEESSLRRHIIDTALAMNACGINRGTSGNVSARWNDGCLITPSGLAYDKTRPADIVFLDRDGHPSGRLAPSSEWRFHYDIYRSRGDVGAIVHTHSSFATTLACLHRDIPAFHYMVAVAGGNSIRCAPYATFGTQQLSDHALAALQDRCACLLANHGMIATGPTLDKALALAVEVEALAEQYWRASQLGDPNLLSEQEMAVVLEKFRGYGQAVATMRPARRKRG